MNWVGVALALSCVFSFIENRGGSRFLDPSGIMPKRANAANQSTKQDEGSTHKQKPKKEVKGPAGVEAKEKEALIGFTRVELCNATCSRRSCSAGNDAQYPIVCGMQLTTICSECYYCYDPGWKEIIFLLRYPPAACGLFFCSLRRGVACHQ